MLHWPASENYSFGKLVHLPRLCKDYLNALSDFLFFSMFYYDGARSASIARILSLYALEQHFCFSVKLV